MDVHRFVSVVPFQPKNLKTDGCLLIWGHQMLSKTACGQNLGYHLNRVIWSGLYVDRDLILSYFFKFHLFQPIQHQSVHLLCGKDHGYHLNRVQELDSMWLKTSFISVIWLWVISVKVICFIESFQPFHYWRSETSVISYTSYLRPPQFIRRCWIPFQQRWDSGLMWTEIFQPQGGFRNSTAVLLPLRMGAVTRIPLADKLQTL